MDTRWKNSPRLGARIMILTLAAAVSLVLSSYSWLREQLFAGVVEITEQMAAQGGYEGYCTTIDGISYCFQHIWRVESSIFWIMLASGGGIALAAFITTLAKSLGLVERRLFSAPAELVGMLGFLALAVMGGCARDIVWFIIFSVSGEFRWELMNEFLMSEKTAGAFVVAVNAVVWSAALGFIYWVTACLTSVFPMGIGRWFRERTITGRMFCWGKKMILNLCAQIQTIDLRDKPTKLLFQIAAANFIVLSLMSCLWFFGIFGILIYSVVLFFLMRRVWNRMREQYGVLLAAAGQMAEGNLEVKITGDLGVFEPLKEEMGRIRNGFKKAVEEEIRSRSMKTELITNVSHDLKTPLTAIITYVDLLKKTDLTPEEREEYIRVLERKSLRLKHLIEDLFEISKADSDNVTLNFVEVDVVSLMKEVRLELEEQIRESKVEFRWKLPEKKVLLWLDSEKTYRIFENLLVNITKYALPGTRAYISIEEAPEEVRITMKNISAAELTLDGDAMTGRFVRGDSSRNTEGSGLGLAIAKSFARIQKGELRAEVDGDLFKVMIRWRKTVAEENGAVAENWATDESRTAMEANQTTATMQESGEMQQILQAPKPAGSQTGISEEKQKKRKWFGRF